MATVPDLITESMGRAFISPMTVDEAKRRIIAANLAPRNVVRVNRSDIHPGVISMVPPPTTTIPDWSDVDIEVNVPTGGGTPRFGGVSNKHGVMPKVRGMMFNIERFTGPEELEKRGFIPSDDHIVLEYDSAPRGKITHQFPPEGTRVEDVDDPDAWRIQVSKGPDPNSPDRAPEEPPVRGKSRIRKVARAIW